MDEKKFKPGEICIYSGVVGDPEEVIFIRYTEVGPTARCRTKNGREVPIHLQQLQGTGQVVDLQQNSDAGAAALALVFGQKIEKKGKGKK